MTATIDREQAVRRIAGHLADRDSYVITTPPDTLTALADTLADIPAWTAYLDNGTPLVLRTNQAAVLLVADALVTTAAILTVPKTVPAAALTKAFGQAVPADGSQDIVILRTDDGPICWPVLFVDAMDIVDPRVAAQLRAAHIPNLN